MFVLVRRSVNESYSFSYSPSSCRVQIHLSVAITIFLVPVLSSGTLQNRLNPSSMWQHFKYFHLTTTLLHGKGPHPRNWGGIKCIQSLTTIWKENQELLLPWPGVTTSTSASKKSGESQGSWKTQLWQHMTLKCWNMPLWCGISSWYCFIFLISKKSTAARISNIIISMVVHQRFSGIFPQRHCTQLCNF